ncbi:MAG: aminoacyl-tRNA deacylase, partial [Desulfovibrio sp.]|nr:aminoacyl-tRNA deacylase [Desulfovibrio sp.]
MAHAKPAAMTNAARLLDELGIRYTLHESEVDLSDLSAVTMARKIGADPEQVFKTLVARGDRTGVVMACLPGSAELDLKALAQASGNKHVEMVQLKEVQPLTGYVRGGCSPLGAKKAYPVFIDEVKSVYIVSENTQVMTSYIRSVDIEGCNPVVLFVYTYPSYTTESKKGTRRTHFQGYHVPSTF